MHLLQHMGVDKSDLHAIGIQLSDTRDLSSHDKATGRLIASKSNIDLKRRKCISLRLI